MKNSEFFLRRQKSHVQPIALGLVYLFSAQTNSRRRDIVFVRQVDGADTRIIGIQAEFHALVSKLFDRVGCIIFDGADMQVRGRTGFQADTLLHQVIDQCRIFDGAISMADTLGARDR